MTGWLLTPAYVPFSLALGLLAGFLALELLSHLVGGSLLSADDGPDLDVDAAAEFGDAFDFEPGAEVDIDALPDAADAPSPGAAAGSGGGILDILGLSGVPLLLWLAAFLLAYGSAGLLVQGVIRTIAGAPMPGPAAAVFMLPFGFAGARAFARSFAAILPRTETTATRAQFFGGLRGTVSQGTAVRGRPAEVRVRDRHGNIHYIRAEPFEEAAELPEGTEVILIRERRGPGDYLLRLLPVPGL